MTVRANTLRHEGVLPQADETDVVPATHADLDDCLFVLVLVTETASQHVAGLALARVDPVALVSSDTA